MPVDLTYPISKCGEIRAYLLCARLPTRSRERMTRIEGTRPAAMAGEHLGSLHPQRIRPG